MFAHAWFQHRDVFWSLETQEGLYIFYKTVCDVYQLIPEENYTVPGEAEGSPPESLSVKIDADDFEPRVSGAAEGAGNVSPDKGSPPDPPSPDGNAQTTLSTGASTRRHKQTPSTGSFVTTIAEGDEDGEGSPETLSLLSTVRRDRSSSPSKRSRTEANIPVGTDGEGRPLSTPDALSEKVKEMSIQDEGKVADKDAPEATLGEAKVEEAPLVADLEG